MKKLNLPACELRLRQNGQKVEVFDIIRKKYVLLTEEEWVRQNFVHYLIGGLGYPKALISLENGLKYNQMSKRSDIVVYARDGSCFMVIECKSPIVKIDQDVFHQAACYNAVLKATFLVTTNGLTHYCCRIDSLEKTAVFQSELPVFGIS
jgi:hypothetical protein